MPGEDTEPGARVFAPWGIGNVVPAVPPSAIVKAARDESIMVLNVTRKLLPPVVGFKRSSTRSAAFSA